MFKPMATFSGFSVKNIEKAKEFYLELGLELVDDNMGLQLKAPNGDSTFIYQKDNHQPATFTVLNFVVKDIDQAIDELTELGVSFEKYEDLPAQQDSKGVLRGLAAGQGPDIAWLKDPDGNILSLVQEK